MLVRKIFIEQIAEYTFLSVKEKKRKQIKKNANKKKNKNGMKKNE